MKKILPICFMLLFYQYSFAQVTYYKGEWTKRNTQDLFTGIFKISKDAEGRVKAAIVWTYVAIDSTNKQLLDIYKGKKGRSGIEYAEGEFYAATNDMYFSGKRTDDPFVILGTDNYHLKLSANNQVLYGTTETGGTNEGMLYALKQNAVEGEKAFKTALVKIKK